MIVVAISSEFVVVKSLVPSSFFVIFTAIIAISISRIDAVNEEGTLMKVCQLQCSLRSHQKAMSD